MVGTPSKYQQDIFKALITTSKNLAIEATAGSGKTTTIVECSKLIKYGAKAAFIAFNKSIVKELIKRLPPNVACSTMHSIGFRAIMDAYGGEKKMFDDKQINFIRPFFDNDKEKNQKKKWYNIYCVDKIMSLVRANGAGDKKKEEIEEILNKQAIDYTSEQLSVAARALKKFYAYNDDPYRFDIMVDYQDMIEMCVRNRDIVLPQYDYLFVDEAQDMSLLDQKFIERLIKPVTGRLISVGDKRQAIYGFRGADPYSFDRIANRNNTIILPLSISYRCGKELVDYAKEIYNEIEWWEEGGNLGRVREGSISEIEEGDMVICRTNYPIITVFFEIIAMGKKAYILGKDIEKGLLGVLAGFDSSERTSEASMKLDSILQAFEQELLLKGIVKPRKTQRYETLFEKISIIRVLFSKFSRVFEVEEFIETIFDDDERDGVALMTVHKCKGLESDRVFLIETFDEKTLMPHEYAVTKDQIIQEKNLMFVARTRGKSEFIRLLL